MKRMMTTKIRNLLMTAAAMAAMSALAPAAWAGCGDQALKKPSAWQEGSRDGMFMPAAAVVGAPTIVGMWSVSFMSGGNMIDFGYQVWHDDGTEFTNSGGRSPSTQNFCLGVWVQTGALTYKLNHFALSYDPSGVLNARVNIKEDVMLDPKGNTYSGPFTIDVYDTKGVTLLQHVAGRIVAKRVTVYGLSGL